MIYTFTHVYASSEKMYIILRCTTRRPRTYTDIFYHINFSSAYIPDIFLFIKRKFLADLNIIMQGTCTTIHMSRGSPNNFIILSSPEPLSCYMNEYLFRVRFLRVYGGSGHRCMTLKYFFY